MPVRLQLGSSMTDELDAVTREQAGRDPNWPADWRARADSAGVEDVNRLASCPSPGCGRPGRS